MPGGPGLAVFTLVGVVVFYAAVPLAVHSGGIALAYLLLYTAPVWVALGAVLWLGERLDAAQVVAVAVTFACVAMVALSAGGTVRISAVSVAWGLTSGIACASYHLSGRRLFEAVPAAVVYAIALVSGGLVLALVTGIDGPTRAMVPWILWLAVGCTWLPCRQAGGVQSTPVNREKSRSNDTMVQRCSMASAARCASLTRLPPTPMGRSRSRTIRP